MKFTSRELILICCRSFTLMLWFKFNLFQSSIICYFSEIYSFLSHIFTEKIVFCFNLCLLCWFLSWRFWLCFLTFITSCSFISASERELSFYWIRCLFLFLFLFKSSRKYFSLIILFSSFNVQMIEIRALM